MAHIQEFSAAKSNKKVHHQGETKRNKGVRFYAKAGYGSNQER